MMPPTRASAPILPPHGSAAAAELESRKPEVETPETKPEGTEPEGGKE